jgi:hypothetical protein
LPVPQEEIDETLVEEYRKAYQALVAGDPRAEEMFAALRETYPDDPLVKLHSERIEAGESGVTLIIRKK